MFWHPEQCPHVLQTTALPVDSPTDVDVFHLSEIPCRATLLLADGLPQHLLFHQAARCFQLVVSGASLRTAVRLLTHAIVDPKNLRAHLTALACLGDLRACGQLLARHFPLEPRGRRLGLVLQALDGWRGGASHREIAIALFGRRRVEADWTDPRNHLRDQVRRALRRGRALMGGGYRQFLR